MVIELFGIFVVVVVFVVGFDFFVNFVVDFVVGFVEEDEYYVFDLSDSDYLHYL